MRGRETILYVKNYITLLAIYKNNDKIFLRIGDFMKKKIFLVLVLMSSLLLLTGGHNLLNYAIICIVDKQTAI